MPKIPPGGRGAIAIALAIARSIFFGLQILPANEVPETFANDIMSNSPAFDVAVKFCRLRS